MNTIFLFQSTQNVLFLFKEREQQQKSEGCLMQHGSQALFIWRPRLPNLPFRRDYTHSPRLTNHIRDTSPGERVKNKNKSGQGNKGAILFL